MGRWVQVGRRYNQRFHVTGDALRVIFKWTFLILVWLTVRSVLASGHVGLPVIGMTAVLIWCAVHCMYRNREPAVSGISFQLLALPVAAGLNPPSRSLPPAGCSRSSYRQVDPSWPPDSSDGRLPNIGPDRAVGGHGAAGIPRGWCPGTARLQFHRACVPERPGQVRRRLGSQPVHAHSPCPLHDQRLMKPLRETRQSVELSTPDHTGRQA